MDATIMFLFEITYLSKISAFDADVTIKFSYEITYLCKVLPFHDYFWEDRLLLTPWTPK